MASHRVSRLLPRTVRYASVLGRSCPTLSTGLLRAASHPHFPAVTQEFSRTCTGSSSVKKFECVNIQDGEDFQKTVQENELPVVVDFHANWCGPCKLLGPRLESIVASKEGKVVLAKVDVDELMDIAMKYNIQAVPTVIAFRQGQVVDKFKGLQGDDQINSFVEKLL